MGRLLGYRSRWLAALRVARPRAAMVLAALVALAMTSPAAAIRIPAKDGGKYPLYTELTFPCAVAPNLPPPPWTPGSIIYDKSTIFSNVVDTASQKGVFECGWAPGTGYDPAAPGATFPPIWLAERSGTFEFANSTLRAQIGFALTSSIDCQSRPQDCSSEGFLEVGPQYGNTGETTGKFEIFDPCEMKVTRVTGIVFVKENGGDRALHVGDTVRSTSSIRTGPGAEAVVENRTVRLRLKGGTKVRLDAQDARCEADKEVNLLLSAGEIISQMLSRAGVQPPVVTEESVTTPDAGTNPRSVAAAAPAKRYRVKRSHTSGGWTTTSWATTAPLRVRRPSGKSRLVRIGKRAVATKARLRILPA